MPLEKGSPFGAGLPRVSSPESLVGLQLPDQMIADPEAFVRPSIHLTSRHGLTSHPIRPL